MKKWTIESAKNCILKNGGYVSKTGAIIAVKPGLTVLGAYDFLKKNQHIVEIELKEEK